MADRFERTRPFAQRAQRAMERDGRSVRELAKAAGVPVATVLTATGRGNVTLDSALRISAALGLDVGELGGLS